MDWRNTRGLSEEEIRRVIAETGDDLTDQDLRALRETLGAQAAAGLNEAVKERFLEQGSVSALQWEEMRERVFVIHDRYTPKMVVSEYQEWCAGEDDEADYDALVEMAGTVPPRGAFAMLNHRLPEHRQARKVGEVSEPVQADVYQAPRRSAWDDD